MKSDNLYKIRVAKSVISNPHEEQQCSHCGYPLYTGDEIYIAETGEGFCGLTCARNELNGIVFDKIGEFLEY